MARRTARVQELREKNELNCMWGLFSILESCQGHPRRKLISNGRRVNEQIIADYPRKLDRVASFDEECRRVQSEAGLRSVAVDARAKSVRNFTQEDMPADNNRIKESIVQRREQAKMDYELDRIVKTKKRARKSAANANHSSSCLNNDASLIHQLASTSAEKSLNKLTLAAILDAVYEQNHQEESKLFENFLRSNLGKWDQVNEITIQQVQMRAKAFVDKMYIDRSFIRKEGSKSYANALQVLNSNNDLLKNSHPSQTEKETIKSVLGCNLSECEGLYAGSSAETRSALVRQRGNINKNSWQRPDKIVILKPAPRNSKHPENILCHCSSLQSLSKLSRRVPDAKPSSFSFREMKRILKHTFGGTSDKLTQEGSTLRVGDECICGGVETRHSFDTSTISEHKRNMWKKQDLKSNRGSDSARLNDSARKKLDFSSVGFSKKRDFDVILEAKKHLSARLYNQNPLEEATSKRSPKTLARILSSPEHDFRPLSPRRDSQYFSGSAQMRFCPYNTSPGASESGSQMPNLRERAGLSPLRSNTEFTSCDDYKNHGVLQLMEAKTCSTIPSGEEEALDSDISSTGNMKSNGEPKTPEINSIPKPNSHISEDVPSEMKKTKIKSPKDDEILTHSILDSLSENKAISSAVDDLPSTPSSIYQSDTGDSIKYQEHRSPVSVLEPFSIEYADSPPSFALQTAKKQLQPRCLHFEECSFESSPQNPSISANTCIEEEEEDEEVDYISQYVQLVLQASFLNWEQLSQIRSPPEELLHASLFDEVDWPPVDCYYDPKLLFDHINEVLLEIYKSYFCSPPWLAFAKPATPSVSLEELVLDEIMREAEFYILPTTERRTLEQLVSEDVAKCRSWLDVRLDTEQVVSRISDEVLAESILDIVLEFCI